MGNNNIKALKSGVWYTIGNFITRAMGFLTMPIFTRIMSSEDVGDYSNFHSWVVILVVITSFDLYTSVAVAKFDKKINLDDYITSSLVLGSLVTFVFYIVSFIFKDFLLGILGFSELEFHIAFLYFLLYPAIQMFQTKNRLFYRYKTSVAVSLFSAIFATGISLACVLLLKEENKLAGRILGYNIPIALLGLILYLGFVKKSHKINPGYWKFGLLISLPLVWHTLSANLLNSSDRIMITNICGKADNAFYSVAYTCALVVSILWNSMNAAWAPWAFEKMDEEDYGALKKASKPYLLFFGLVVVVFLLMAPEILLLMGGTKYLAALPVIPPVMVAYVYQFVNSLYINIETFKKKQKYIAIGTTVAAVVNIGLNFIFIPMFGYVAAAYTTLAGYVILFILHYSFVSRMGFSDWYDTRFNLIFLGGFSAGMFLTILLYQSNIVRYVFICVIIIASAVIMIKIREGIAMTLKQRSLKPVITALKQLRK